jgi:hypothetical protein
MPSPSLILIKVVVVNIFKYNAHPMRIPMRYSILCFSIYAMSISNAPRAGTRFQNAKTVVGESLNVSVGPPKTKWGGNTAYKICREKIPSKRNEFQVGFIFLSSSSVSQFHFPIGLRLLFPAHTQQH